MNQHGIIGDTNFNELPETTIDPEQLVEEKKMAKYSKTAEFKRIKDYMEARIEFWKLRQPNGTPIVAKQVTQDMVNDWIIANHIVAEFQAFLSEFENAAKAVENVQR